MKFDVSIYISFEVGQAALHLLVRLINAIDLLDGSFDGRSRSRSRLEYQSDLTQFSDEALVNACLALPLHDVRIQQVPAGPRKHANPDSRTRLHKAFSRKDFNGFT